MITVLQHGKGFNGKQNLIKEFILMPRNNLKEVFFFNKIWLIRFKIFFILIELKGIEIISKVNRNIRDTLYQSKTQPGVCIIYYFVRNKLFSEICFILK